jgi:hypothetical protein
MAVFTLSWLLCLGGSLYVEINTFLGCSYLFIGSITIFLRNDIMNNTYGELFAIQEGVCTPLETIFQAI